MKTAISAMSAKAADSKRGYSQPQDSFALLKGEPAHHADGHHFEGVAVVEFKRVERNPLIPCGRGPVQHLDNDRHQRRRHRRDIPR